MLSLLRLYNYHVMQCPGHCIPFAVVLAVSSLTGSSSNAVGADFPRLVDVYGICDKGVSCLAV